jgi:hypothetical protein
MGKRDGISAVGALSSKAGAVLKETRNGDFGASRG